MVNKNSSATAKDISYLLWQITKRLGRGKQRFLESFGLTTSQMEILGALYHLSEEGTEEEITQIVLSKHTFIDPMTTSTIIRNLEKKELLYRSQSKIDSRAVCVNISEKGADLFRTVVKEVDGFVEFIYKDMNKDFMRTQLAILLDNIKKNNC